MTPIHLTGLGNISPQKTFDNDGFLDEVTGMETTHLKVVDPVYKDFISGDILRRMGRISKMGITAAKLAMKDAGCDMPDAIITGTGLGCIEDTEKFLTSMIRNKEEFLTPTSFIQSTHNTVGAQIALLLKCHQYNFTYVHRGASFESALLDAMTRLHTGQSGEVLLGGIDELTPQTLAILQRLGHTRIHPVNNLQALTRPARGAVAGEGSAFFVLSSRPGSRPYASIRDLRILFYPGKDEIESVLTELTAEGKPDAIVLGVSGDTANDRVYEPFRKGILRDLPQICYKHLCGEYFTASAFSLWLGARILSSGTVPEIVRLGPRPPAGIKKLLLYNHFRNINHSFILISRP